MLRALHPDAAFYDNHKNILGLSNFTGRESKEEKT